MAGKKRKLRVTPQRKRHPDYRKMSAALQIYLQAQAEADAERERRGLPPASGSAA